MSAIGERRLPSMSARICGHESTMAIQARPRGARLMLLATVSWSGRAGSISHQYVRGPGPNGGIGVMIGTMGGAGGGGVGRNRLKLAESRITMWSKTAPELGAVVVDGIGTCASK